MDFMLVPYLALIVLRTLYYPMKDLFGPDFCYILSWGEVSVILVAQFHTFFVTLYRFICIFYDDEIFQLNLSPKVWKILVSKGGYVNSKEKGNILKMFNVDQKLFFMIFIVLAALVECNVS